MSALIEALALFGITALLIWGLRRCLRTGVATPGHYIQSNRDQQPVLFWLQLSVYALAALASFALAIQCLGHASPGW
ncbi:hypothetical protein [Sphingomonas aerolata]|jgi:hypothetical protein|uniref:hypothetical protein n=1 Tax=Sphingomonas aerolata TaxID=185951 RepID=UPI003358F27A